MQSYIIKTIKNNIKPATHPNKNEVCGFSVYTLVVLSPETLLCFHWWICPQLEWLAGCLQLLSLSSLHTLCDSGSFRITIPVRSGSFEAITICTTGILTVPVFQNNHTCEIKVLWSHNHMYYKDTNSTGIVYYIIPRKIGNY